MPTTTVQCRLQTSSLIGRISTNTVQHVCGNPVYKACLWKPTTVHTLCFIWPDTTSCELFGCVYVQSGVKYTHDVNPECMFV